MSAASARQSQRVLIDAPVRLTLREASRSMPARVLDLSEGGMRLSAEAPLSVGDEVTCNLELDNERAVLPGCVRWSKPAALSGSGAGVQFGELSDDQLALLRRWLAHNSQHAQTVLLHVPSLREPLRARGCVTADGLQLTAALPQLAPGVELEFQLGDSGSRRLGRIERLDVRSRAEQGGLELALRLQPSAATARSRRNLVYGLPDSPSGLEAAGMLATREAHALASRAPARSGDSREAGRPRPAQIRPRPRPNQLVSRKRSDTLHIPKSPLVRLGRRALWLAAALTVAFALWNQFGPDAESPDMERLAQEHSAMDVPQDQPNHASALQPARAEAPPPTLDHEAAHPQPSVPVSASSEDEKPPAPEKAVVSESAPAAEDVRMPTLHAAGAKSEVFVPMQGTLRGLRSTQWTDPLAIVLELPDAHIDSPELLRGLRGGGVRRVRLDASHEVPRLQIFLNTVAARFGAKLVPHGLLVVLEHDLQPLPQQ